MIISIERWQAMATRGLRVFRILSALILTFIGVIVSSRKTRGGVGFQIALGFLIAFIFIILFIASKSMAETGSLNPKLAVWMPNIIFSGVCYSELSGIDDNNASLTEWRSENEYQN